MLLGLLCNMSQSLCAVIAANMHLLNSGLIEVNIAKIIYFTFHNIRIFILFLIVSPLATDYKQWLSVVRLYIVPYVVHVLR